MQLRPFVHRVDLIDKGFMSFIAHDKEARWQHHNIIEKVDKEEIKETQNTSLPLVIRAPLQLNTVIKSEKPDEPDKIIEFFFSIEKQSISLVNK